MPEYKDGVSDSEAESDPFTEALSSCMINSCGLYLQWLLVASLWMCTAANVRDLVEIIP